MVTHASKVHHRTGETSADAIRSPKSGIPRRMKRRGMPPCRCNWNDLCYSWCSGRALHLARARPEIDKRRSGHWAT